MNIANSTLYPCVMGIINVTPDSFHAASRVQEAGSLRARVRQILDEGGAILDVGACSTRPGSPSVSEADEMQRLRWALPIVHEAVAEWLQLHPEAPKPRVSVDTFRARVAEECVTALGAGIINDISGGTIEPAMLDVVARTGAAYILMHMRGTPLDMQQLTDYPLGVTPTVSAFFAEQLHRLHEACLRAGRSPMPEVILDPGYGFAKTVEQNYELMRGLRSLIEAYPQCPMLVGISRKSMIQRVLGVDAAHALNGTSVLNTFALLQGAHILRVHDVREAVEALTLCRHLLSSSHQS